MDFLFGMNKTSITDVTPIHKMNKIPIVITPYNRPDYFEEMIHSLIPQIGFAEVHLFMDGARNGDDMRAINECIAYFKKKIPFGTVHESNKNLGVAGNVLRARTYIFEWFDAAIFLEDDVVLERHYIKQLGLLLEMFKDDPSIGAVSCFGEYHKITGEKPYTWRDQHYNRSDLVSMNHFWAYAMTATCFNASWPLLSEYFDLLPDEYRNRPNDKIKKLFDEWGFNDNHSSQDTATELAMLATGFIKVATFTNNLTYIGREGEHSKGFIFDASGFPDYQTYTKEVESFGWDEEIKDSVRDELLKRTGAHKSFKTGFKYYE